jgi:hypothetical protein
MLTSAYGREAAVVVPCEILAVSLLGATHGARR